LDKERRQPYDEGVATKYARLAAHRPDLLKVAAARDACSSGAARALRLSARLSLAEVANEIGAGDPTTVWRWETGQRRPRGALAERYADLLDLLATRGRG
jgi:hypothetical protein